MTKKKSEKVFLKEVKTELTSYFVKDFREVILDLAKQYNIEVDTNYLDNVILSKDKRVPLDGMTLMQLGKYIKEYPNAVIVADYSYPQYHNKTIDALWVKLESGEYAEEDSEVLADIVASWMYKLYSQVEEIE